MADPLKELFAAAVDLPPEERAGFVAGAVPDPAQRRQLLRLLAAHDAAGDFLDHPVQLVEAAADATAAADDGLAAGDRVGLYTLVARLGSGGFGSVWRARQTAPVERDVALKVLHDGPAPALVMARFLGERQTLARMQHPSIAKVFDAGTTDDGRPWLAMELVEGQPITQHCAAADLPLPARLGLFAEVCLAVQHAHHKGVVHRDLKPGNVLVTELGARALPVVIDFGVARAVGGEGRAEAAGQALGTPDYMSPEQAADDGSAVDTRTDVYSLGVVLYELVAGQRPFARPEGPAGQRELLRRIREEQPLPPSRSPARLPGVGRELDWITARAMAKDPAWRYPTAAALADDVQRLLAGEAVQAAPPSALYRCSKFVRRHRLAVAAAAAVAASLGIGAWVAGAGWIQARAAEARARADQAAAEREAKKATRALDLLDELWEAADPARFGRPDYPVRELFADFERGLARRVADEPAVELRVRLTLGRLQRILGMIDHAGAHADRAVALSRELGDPPTLAKALLEQARCAFDRGDIAAATAAAEAITGLVADQQLADAELHAEALEVLAGCGLRRGDRDSALSFAEATLTLRRQLPSERQAPLVARSLLLLANVHGSAGRTGPALQFVREALQHLVTLGPDHPDTLVALQHLGYLQMRQGDAVAAEATYRDSLTRRRQLYGDEHPHVAWAEADLAWLLHERGRNAEARPLLEHALAALRERLGEQHLFVTESLQRLGTVLTDLRELELAERALRDAAQRFRSLPGHPVEGLVGCLGNLAALQWARGDRAAARQTYEEGLTIAAAQLPPEHFVTSVARTNLARLLGELGEREAAVALLQAALQASSAAGRAGEAKIQRQRLAALLRELGRTSEAEQVERAGEAR